MKKKVLSKLTVCAVVLMLASLIPVGCVPNGGGSGQRNCVVVIGDSIFRLYNNIIPEFERLSGFRVRRYDTSGAEMVGGLTTNIVAQFRMALNQGHVRTLIMDGGGNDFIISGAMTNASQQVLNGYREIFELAAQRGVENIVVMGYYRTMSTSGVTDKSEEDVQELTLNYARSLGLNTAHFDPSDNKYFANRMPAQYTIDTIHPVNAAGKELAALIWATMSQDFGRVVTSDQNYEPMEQGNQPCN